MIVILAFDIGINESYLYTSYKRSLLMLSDAILPHTDVLQMQDSTGKSIIDLPPV